MGYRILDVPDMLRREGYEVRTVPGWETRGAAFRGWADIRGVMGHHTVGPARGDMPSLDVLIQGRPDVAGPLANFGLSRSGIVYVVASGVANHAGRGGVSWIGVDNANQRTLGIEAESTGTGDWTPQQLQTFPALVASLLRHYQKGADRYLAHAEWTTRKIDPYGWPGGHKGFRQTVHNYLSGENMALTPEDLRKIRSESWQAEADFWGGDLPAGNPDARPQQIRDYFKGLIQETLAEVHAKLDVLGGGITDISAALENHVNGPQPLTFEETKEAVVAGAGDAIEATPFRVDGVTLTPDTDPQSFGQ